MGGGGGGGGGALRHGNANMRVRVGACVRVRAKGAHTLERSVRVTFRIYPSTRSPSECDDVIRCVGTSAERRGRMPPHREVTAGCCPPPPPPPPLHGGAKQPISVLEQGLAREGVM